MQWTLYLSLLPIGFGVMTFVVSMICLFGYITSDNIVTKKKLFNWFLRLITVAILLIGVGGFFASRHF
ncbi:hypothetical protein PSAR109036_03925 [Psychrobacter arenosus]|uniref:hypothetical protein n=1 Tax=Psychrobacter arenosus TaxID=256326 RepID=UPI0019196DDC|nr:hypothetical protein [Psychrobacter arenosus]